MSTCIDDDKHHINYKIMTDHLRLTRYVRENCTGLVNHTGSCMVICVEYEKHEDAISQTYVLMHVFPSSNELSLACLEIGVGEDIKSGTLSSHLF